ncbi:MAG: alpha/beta hydrolase family protein [Pyrinomonadaceae bacterium]
MKILMMAFFLICYGAATMIAAQSKNDYGKFLVFSEGQQLGFETFTIRNDETAERADTLNIGNNAVNFKTSTAYKNARPSSFTLAQEPNVMLRFAFNEGNVKMRGAHEATAQTDAGAVILENNVWHQYQFLIKRYDKQKGGAQAFKAFVPSIMQTLPVSLELRTSLLSISSSGTGAATTQLVDYYRLHVAGGLAMDILTDAGGKLIYVRVPKQRAEVVREEYGALMEAIRAKLDEQAKYEQKNTRSDYSAPANASFTAEEVTVTAKGFTLAGTLLVPKASSSSSSSSGARLFPAVVMITGSGQQTRDESIGIPGLENFKPFRQIAEKLASNGIAVLRVDDRGTGGSTGRNTLLNATTFDFADDTRAQVAFLRARKDIDPNRIALVGHSEGGVIAPIIAASDPRIAAIALLAGTGKRGAEAITDQANYELENNQTMSAAEKQAARAEQQEFYRAVATGGDLSKYPAEAKLPWVKAFITYDPLPTIRKVRQPVLILQGALDRQVTAGQATLLEEALMAAGNKDVTKRVFPNLNHLFLLAKTGAFSEYSSLPSTTIGDDVLAVLSDWLKLKLRAGK